MDKGLPDTVHTYPCISARLPLSFVAQPVAVCAKQVCLSGCRVSRWGEQPASEAIPAELFCGDQPRAQGVLGGCAGNLLHQGKRRAACGGPQKAQGQHCEVCAVLDQTLKRVLVSRLTFPNQKRNSRLAFSISFDPLHSL